MAEDTLPVSTGPDERSRDEERLKRWGEIFRNIRIGVVVGSAGEMTLKMMNPAYAEMHGYTVEELTGKPLSAIYAPEVGAKMLDILRMADEKGYYSGESMHMRRDGSIFPVQLDINVVKNEKGAVLYRIFNVQDITERKRAEETIKYQAYHNPVTGLSNREMFLIYLNLEIAQARRDHKKFAVLYVDLDRFKSINDTHGHEVGDEVRTRPSRSDATRPTCSPKSTTTARASPARRSRWRAARGRRRWATSRGRPPKPPSRRSSRPCPTTGASPRR